MVIHYIVTQLAGVVAQSVRKTVGYGIEHYKRRIHTGRVQKDNIRVVFAHLHSFCVDHAYAGRFTEFFIINYGVHDGVRT